MIKETEKILLVRTFILVASRFPVTVQLFTTRRREARAVLERDVNRSLNSARASASGGSRCMNFPVESPRELPKLRKSTQIDIGDAREKNGNGEKEEKNWTGWIFLSLSVI